MLARSKTLQVLTDIGESHATHGQQAFMTRDNVRTMMEEVASLRTVVTSDRIWTVRLPLLPPSFHPRLHLTQSWTLSHAHIQCDKNGDWRSKSLNLKLEKRKNACPTYWFLPR